MKVIVIGYGNVGKTVVKELAAAGHQLTVIDVREANIADAMAQWDVMGVVGNGASHRVLSEAGVEDSDLVIAATPFDEINMLSCLLARKMGAGSTVARIGNPEYSEELKYLRDGMGLSMAVNPDRDAAAEILRILKFPAALNIESFSRGKIKLASFIADEKCALTGKTVKEGFTLAGGGALACAVERENEVFIPDGSFEIKKGDLVAVLSEDSLLPQFFGNIGLPSPDIRRIMLIGGSKLAYYLAADLEKMKVGVTIIEKDPKAAAALKDRFPKANVIVGDGSSRALLMEEGLGDMDAVCTLTGIDEENIFISLFARNAVPGIKTVTKLKRLDFQEITESLDIGSAVYPKNTTAARIIKHVRAREKRGESDLRSLYRIINQKAEALEFKVSEESPIVNVPLSELKVRKDAIIGSIIRDGAFIIPHGRDVMLPGDHVIVVTTASGVSSVEDIVS